VLLEKMAKFILQNGKQKELEILALRKRLALSNRCNQDDLT
jgi:hypothetical protein